MKYLVALFCVLALLSCSTVTNELKTLQDINDKANAIPYAYDIDKFGVEDYWQLPTEMVENNFGDCEDYTLLKANQIIKSGLASKSDLKFIYVAVRYSNPTDYHMLLQYKDKYILDNANPVIESAFDVYVKYYDFQAAFDYDLMMGMMQFKRGTK